MTFCVIRICTFVYCKLSKYMYVCMYVQPLRPPIIDRQRLSPNFPWIFPAADPAVFRPRLASLRFPRPAEVSGLWLYQNQRAGRLKRTQNNCHSCVPVPVSASSLKSTTTSAATSIATTATAR